MAPQRAAVDDYAEHVAAFMPRTAWTGACSSWFKQPDSSGARGEDRGEGVVTALHPGSRVHFFHMLSAFRGEDWEYTYDAGRSRNRFAYLGNGFSRLELDPACDSTWYLEEDRSLPR